MTIFNKNQYHEKRDIRNKGVLNLKESGLRQYSFKRYIGANTTQIINFDNIVSPAFLKISWWEPGTPATVPNAGIKIKSFTPDNREIVLYDFTMDSGHITVYGTAYDEWQKFIVLPIMEMGDLLQIEFTPESTGCDVFISLMESNNEFMLNKTSRIIHEVPGSNTIGTSSSKDIDFFIPYGAKFCSIGAYVTDANDVSKDYELRALVQSTAYETLESDLAQTNNYSFFDLIPINPLFRNLNIKIDNNDGTNTILWIYFVVQWYF